MIIDDVPMESVKNLQTNFDDLSKSSLIYANFQLVGMLKNLDLALSPVIQHFSEPLNIHATHKFHFQ